MHSIRSFRLAALGAALVVGTATVAPAQPPATAPGQQGETSRRDRQGPRGRQMQRNRDLAGRALFRGITLTEAQKSQIQGIRRKYAEQGRAFAKDLREKSGANTAQRADSATRARVRTQLATEGRARMERQVAELRGVLTADQRATFDKNFTMVRERMQARAAGSKQRGPGGERRRGFRRNA